MVKLIIFYQGGNNLYHMASPEKAQWQQGERNHGGNGKKANSRALEEALKEAFRPVVIEERTNLSVSVEPKTIPTPVSHLGQNSERVAQEPTSPEELARIAQLFKKNDGDVSKFSEKDKTLYFMNKVKVGRLISPETTSANNITVENIQRGESKSFAEAASASKERRPDFTTQLDFFAEKGEEKVRPEETKNIPEKNRVAFSEGFEDSAREQVAQINEKLDGLHKKSFERAQKAGGFAEKAFRALGETWKDGARARYKIALGVTLVAAGMLATGGTVTAIAGGAVALRVAGAAATYVTLDGLMRVSGEKKLGVEGNEKYRMRQKGLALTMAALVGSGFVGETLQNAGNGIGDVWNQYGATEKISDAYSALKDKSGSLGGLWDKYGPTGPDTPSSGSIGNPPETPPGSTDTAGMSAEHLAKAGVLGIEQEKGAKVFEVQKGDTVWKLVGDNIPKEYLDGVAPDQKVYVIDALKDRLAAMSPEQLRAIGISSGNIDKLAIGDKINLSSVLEDKTLLEKVQGEAKGFVPQPPASLESVNVPSSLSELPPDAKVVESVLKPTPEKILEKGVFEANGVRGKFTYSPSGEVTGLSYEGNSYGIGTPERVLNPNWRKEMTLNPKFNPLKDKNFAWDQVNLKAQGILMELRILNGLEDAQSPEAQYLRNSIQGTVERMEKQYGDIFKDIQEILPQAPLSELPPDAEVAPSVLGEVYRGPEGTLPAPAEIVPSVLAQEASMATAETLSASVEGYLKEDLDGLFGKKGFLGIGAQTGLESPHWNGPAGFARVPAEYFVGTGSAESLETLKASTTANTGYGNEKATQKMTEYITNVRQATGIPIQAGEGVEDYIRRAMTGNPEGAARV